jgi:integrase
LLIESGKASQVGAKRPATVSTELFDFLEYYLQHKTAKGGALSTSTVALYRRLARTHLEAFLGRKLETITRLDVEAWFASLKQSGKLTTAAKCYKLLKALFSFAIELELVETNPCRIKGAQNLSSGTELPTPDWNTALAICEAMPSTTDRMLALLSLTANLRYSEAIALKRESFSSETIDEVLRFKVSISNQLKLVEGQWVTTAPKTKAGIRSTYLPGWLTPELESYLSKLKQPSDYLFRTANGGPYRHDFHARAWRKATAQLGLEDKGYSHHSLRRAVATYLASQGANQDELRLHLGHSSVVAAVRYVRDTGRGAALAELLPNAGT